MRLRHRSPFPTSVRCQATVNSSEVISITRVLTGELVGSLGASREGVD
jgi:hypothetical protein